MNFVNLKISVLNLAYLFWLNEFFGCVVSEVEASSPCLDWSWIHYHWAICLSWKQAASGFFHLTSYNNLSQVHNVVI